jgi:hypothetical protein
MMLIPKSLRIRQKNGDEKDESGDGTFSRFKKKSVNRDFKVSARTRSSDKE